MHFLLALPLLAATLLAAPIAAAQVMPDDNEADSLRLRKRAYTLLRPTPTALLRPLSTDRPDATESPYSLDAGHFQLETDLLRLTRLRDENKSRTQEVAFNHINLKLGLTSTTDIQVVVETFTVQKTTSPEAVTHQRGFGDVTLRLKRNIWGNDGGNTALALMPFVKLPTGRRVGNGAIEGGIVTPFAWQLPHNWTMGTQLQATLARDDDANEHFLEMAPTLTLGHDVYQNLGGFVEVATAWDTRGSRWTATFNTGPTLRIGDNLQLDIGTNLPLTDATPVSWFLGLSVRR